MPKAIQRWFFFLTALVVATAGLQILLPRYVRAAEPVDPAAIERASFRFVDRATIQATIGGEDYTFFDRDIGDDILEYAIVDGGKCDEGYIYLTPGESNGLSITGVQGSGGVVQIQEAYIGYLTAGVGEDCSDYVTLYDKGAATTGQHEIWFKWIDAGTIQRVDGRSQEVFVQAQAPADVSPRVFVDRNDGSCADIILVSEDKRSMRMYRLESANGDGDDQLDDVNEADRALLAPVFPASCEVYGTVQREDDKTTRRVGSFIQAESNTMGSFEATSTTAGDGQLVGGGTSAGTNADITLGPDCYSGLATAFAWIICPTLGMVDDLIDKVEDVLLGYLDVNLGDENQLSKLQDSWAVFARIASALLVIVALVMIISTALGFGIFDAYTVKKVLPRLVIATIGIWASFSIILAYVEIMNTLGRGIGELMLAPFAQDLSDMSLQNIAGNAASDTDALTEGVFTGLAALGVIGGIASIGGVFGLIGLAITVAFGFIVALVTLTLREMMIVALLILAPLGIAAWILPNTEKIWKLWSGTLNKLLLMFPMIVALIASGKIFAYLFSQSSADGFFSLVIPLIAYVLPFFLLPATFKAAGGAFSRITGVVNNKSKGVFDKGKGWAGEKKKQSDSRQAEAKARRRAMERQGITTGSWVGSRALSKTRKGVFQNKASQYVAGSSAVSGNRAIYEEQLAVEKQKTIKVLQDRLVQGGDGAMSALLRVTLDPNSLDSELKKLRDKGDFAGATSLQSFVSSGYHQNALATSAAAQSLAGFGRIEAPEGIDALASAYGAKRSSTGEMQFDTTSTAGKQAASNFGEALQAVKLAGREKGRADLGNYGIGSNGKLDAFAGARDTVTGGVKPQDAFGSVDWSSISKEAFKGKVPAGSPPGTIALSSYAKELVSALSDSAVSDRFIQGTARSFDKKAADEQAHILRIISDHVAANPGSTLQTDFNTRLAEVRAQTGGTP